MNKLMFKTLKSYKGIVIKKSWMKSDCNVMYRAYKNGEAGCYLADLTLKGLKRKIDMDMAAE